MLGPSVTAVRGLRPVKRMATEPSHGPRERLDGVARLSLVAVAAVLVYAAFRTFASFAAAIVLGAWGAHLARPLFTRLAGALHGRERAAALLTGSLVIIGVAPVVLAVASLAPAARSLFDQLRSSHDVRRSLEALVSSGGDSGDGIDVVQLVREHGATASKVVARIASTSLDAVLGVFVFFVVFFAGLVRGGQLAAWFEEHAPLDPLAQRRLGAAFFQAGRGLLVGSGITALVQGGLATVTYVALGVPRAMLFGVLTVVAALIPMTGPAIVWAPVAAGLVLTDHPVKAAILVGMGVFVVGLVDNVLRPYLAGRAHIGLDASVVLVAIFGGIAVFGGWGLVLGPLVVRLAAEALALVRERT